MRAIQADYDDFAAAWDETETPMTDAALFAMLLDPYYTSLGIHGLRPLSFDAWSEYIPRQRVSPNRATGVFHRPPVTVS